MVVPKIESRSAGRGLLPRTRGACGLQTPVPWAWGLSIRETRLPTSSPVAIPGCVIHEETNVNAAVAIVARRPVDIIFVNLHQARTAPLLTTIRWLDPNVPIIVYQREPHPGPVESGVRIRTVWLRTPVDQATLASFAGNILHACFRPEANVEHDRLPEQPPSRTQTLLDRIRELSSPVTVRALAREVRLSTRALHQAFRSSCGVAPKTYMLRVRVSRAIALLRNSEEPLKVIAYRVGCYDAAHLTHDIVKLTGLTPGAHRKLTRPLRLASHDAVRLPIRTK